jgi:hypothetical protein
MRIRILALSTLFCLVAPAAARAQDFGVMNSAETINRGNFKFLGSPMIVFGEDGADNDVGVALAAGYGFTDSLDLEAKAAFYEGLTFIGADIEFWVAKQRDQSPLDVSVIAGLHRGLRDAFDTTSLDFTILGSGHVTPRFELYGGLDFSRSFIDDSDEDFTTIHLVPGIEIALGPDLDFVAEVGLGLNDDARNYVSAGLAFYVR